MVRDRDKIFYITKLTIVTNTLLFEIIIQALGNNLHGIYLKILFLTIEFSAIFEKLYLEMTAFSKKRKKIF